MCGNYSRSETIWGNTVVFLIWLILEAGQNLENNFIQFLVQMRTRKFAFEIHWSLAKGIPFGLEHSQAGTLRMMKMLKLSLGSGPALDHEWNLWNLETTYESKATPNPKPKSSVSFWSFYRHVKLDTLPIKGSKHLFLKNEKYGSHLCFCSNFFYTPWSTTS